ncbi:MAG TPA: hypothetical protein VFJ43_07080, partial [Bacteroidia bacterium]|nr:hypothetical protein [Bacteroidia bacterium]
NIYSWNTELNGHIMLPMDNGTGYFKILLGAAYLDWKGNYTGIGLNGAYTYHKGDLIHYKFLEGNIGVGFTQQIGDRSFIDFAFTIRISSEDHRYGLTDTSFQLKYRFAPEFNEKEKSDSENENVKTENGIPKGKYKWLKKKR